MMRLLSIGIDCVSAAIFVIPALAILCDSFVFSCGCSCGCDISDRFWSESDTVYRHCKQSVCIYEKYDFEYHFIYTDGIFCTCGLEEFPVFQNYVFHGTRGITGD